MGTPAFAGQTKYTSGSSFFAVSKQALRKANSLSRHGRWKELESMANLELIKVPPQGTPVQVDTYNSGTYRVRFPGSETIWWTTGDALMNRSP